MTTTSPCIESDWPKFKDGYHRKDNRLAHRAAWEDHHNVQLDRWQLVLHSCGNPGCVNLDHLYIGTQKDNADDRERHGRTARGERHGMTADFDKVTAEALINSGLSRREVARQLGVSHTTINHHFPLKIRSTRNV